MATVKHETYDQQGNLISSVDVEVPAEVTNRDLIMGQIKQVITLNKSFIASTPNAAQVTAQVKFNTRILNNILRLLSNELDSTD